MDVLDRVLTWIEDFLGVASLGGAAIIAIVQVIARYIFNSSIVWGQELVIYLIIFSTFVGAVITLRNNEHVNVNILSSLGGEGVKWLLTLLSALAILVYCAAMGIYGWLMLFTPGAHSTLSPALHVPLWIPETSVPIGLTLMFLRSLQILYRTIRHRDPYPDAETGQYRDEV